MIPLSQSLFGVLPIPFQVIVVNNSDQFIDKVLTHEWIELFGQLGKVRMFLAERLSTQVMHPIP